MVCHIFPLLYNPLFFWRMRERSVFHQKYPVSDRLEEAPRGTSWEVWVGQFYLGPNRVGQNGGGPKKTRFLYGYMYYIYTLFNLL